MILLVNPRATKPVFRRFPLSIMALGAALPKGTTWDLVDGNQPNRDSFEEIAGRVNAAAGGPDPVRLLAFSVMPGPQLAAAVPLTRRLRERYPRLPIVWGGYFPSLYPRPVLQAPYVDWIVRGQGEQTLVELLEVLGNRRDPAAVLGLGYRERGTVRLNPERPWVGPNELPSPPYDRIDVGDYLEATFLGSRTGVYQASIGCPYTCNFCGVISVYGSREKFEEPARTARNLEFLVRNHGMNGLHFYDNNFFMAEAHTRELCARILPLGLNWWCEARVDIVLRYEDATLAALRKSGLRMIFFGAESGSDEALAKMSKRLTTEQTFELAKRLRHFDIIPEFSFVLGGPDEPEREIDMTLGFVRKLKSANPACELIFYFYTPIPQREGAYGDIDPLAGTPEALEDWTAPEWIDWMTHEKPDVPWMTPALRAHVANFELVLKSRFPSLHDVKTRPWGKALAARLAKTRWESGRFENPRLLRGIRRLARIPRENRQLYGHLRPPAETGQERAW